MEKLKRMDKLKKEGRKEGLFVVSESRESDIMCEGTESKEEKFCGKYDCN